MSPVTAAHPDQIPHDARRRDMERWRERSQLIRRLRVALPLAIGAILAFLAGSVLWTTLTGQAEQAEAEAPIRLVNPRFVGRDDKGRAFVITAASAMRDEQDYQTVHLDQPAVVLDEEGPNPMRISARAGVYHEERGLLNLQGGVRLNGADASFDTASSVFNTATGELGGSGPITGSGSLGEIEAKSYGVYEKGERMVFRGGVRARIDSK